MSKVPIVLRRQAAGQSAPSIRWFMDWNLINTVPLDREVEIAIIDSKDVHVVACPCRLTHHGWVAAESKRRLYWVQPTHWRDLSLNENSPEPVRGPEFPVAPLF